MEEIIGFTLVGLLVLAFGVGIKKLFTKKKDAFQYEDEIILDKKILHYGPFSGCRMNANKNLLLLLAVSSSSLFAEISLRTLDNWGIDSYSSENLILQKTSEDTKSNLYIEMARPYCISSSPTITTPVGSSNYSEEDLINATMIVDRNKPKNIVLKVHTVIPGRGNTKDYVLKLKYFPSIAEAKSFDIKFKNETPLEDMSFSINGIFNAVKQSERICMGGYEFQEPEIKETNYI